MTGKHLVSRSLLLSLLVATPLLVGAEGGGCAPDDDVPIGSDDAGGGVGEPCGPNTCAKGETCCNESCGTCVKPGEACDMLLCAPDGGAGEPCGNNVCGAGEYCCNASCGTCAKLGEGCTAIACEDPCHAQDAVGQGNCLLFLGYGWNGSSCEIVGGCTCSGADCASLYDTEDECKQAFSACGATGQPCGPVTCGPGTTCCNESCGTCVAPGQACDQVLCTPECAAQDASGYGVCTAFFGYAWNGQSCEGIGGCGCAGSDCDALYASPADCAAAHAKC